MIVYAVNYNFVCVRVIVVIKSSPGGDTLAFDKKKYNVEYKRENLKRIPLDVPREKYDEIKTHSAARSETVNGFIKRAIDETISNDKAKQPL